MDSANAPHPERTFAWYSKRLLPGLIWYLLDAATRADESWQARLIHPLLGTLYVTVVIFALRAKTDPEHPGGQGPILR